MATYYSTIKNYNNKDHIQIAKAPSLQEELKGLPRFSPKRCIYRVPHHLRMANEGAYTPLVVSIGPLHYNDDHLQATKLHKLKYLESFLNRSKRELEDFLKIVRNHELEIRKYYADPMVGEIGREEFVRMVLVDATFLIELFCRSWDYNHRSIAEDKDDQIFHCPRMVVEVCHDISLEENQLPLFILTKLYDEAKFNEGDFGKGFLDIVCAFLNIKKEPQIGESYNHFLDLLRFSYLPKCRRERYHNVEITTNESGVEPKSTDQPSSQCFRWKIARCPRTRNEKSTIKPNNIVCKTATTLHEAGVKFIKSDVEPNKDASTQLDIKFDREKGMLTIPQILLQDDTEALLKNLAVFEQCHYFDDSYIIDYISFLDFLINTPEDVALLAKEGIIESWLGSDEKVADLFNGLNKYLRMRVDNFYYAKQTEELNEYYNRPWNRHRAVLRHTYFNHPWATISVVYAVVLLALTVLQAATGVISVFPWKH